MMFLGIILNETTGNRRALICPNKEELEAAILSAFPKEAPASAVIFDHTFRRVWEAGEVTVPLDQPATLCAFINCTEAKGPETAYIIECDGEVDLVEETKEAAHLHVAELRREGFATRIHVVPWAEQDNFILRKFG